jgi:hypothetical protein
MRAPRTLAAFTPNPGLGAERLVESIPDVVMAVTRYFDPCVFAHDTVPRRPTTISTGGY